MGNPATGPKSNSFQIWLATFIPSLAGAVTGFTTNAGGSKSAALGVASVGAGVLATLGKLWHDGVFNKANLENAYSGIVAEVPKFKLDAEKVLGFVEGDFPGLKEELTAVDEKFATLEAKIPDAAGLESLVRSVVSSILVVPPVPTAPITVTPPPA